MVLAFVVKFDSRSFEIVPAELSSGDSDDSDWLRLRAEASSSSTSAPGKLSC